MGLISLAVKLKLRHLLQLRFQDNPSYRRNFKRSQCNDPALSGICGYCEADQICFCARADVPESFCGTPHPVTCGSKLFSRLGIFNQNINAGSESKKQLISLV